MSFFEAVEPLQTHERMETIWIPPKGDRFVTWEPQDTWLKELGLGETIRRKERLFDVLDPQMRSIGYTDQDPSRRSIGGHRIQLSNPGCYAVVNVKQTDRFNGFKYWEADPDIARFDFIVEALPEGHYQEWKRRKEAIRFRTEYDMFPVIGDKTILVNTAGL